MAERPRSRSRRAISRPIPANPQEGLATALQGLIVSSTQDQLKLEIEMLESMDHFLATRRFTGYVEFGEGVHRAGIFPRGIGYNIDGDPHLRARKYLAATPDGFRQISIENVLLTGFDAIHYSYQYQEFENVLKKVGSTETGVLTQGVTTVRLEDKTINLGYFDSLNSRYSEPTIIVGAKGEIVRGYRARMIADGADVIDFIKRNCKTPTPETLSATTLAIAETRKIITTL